MRRLQRACKTMATPESTVAGRKSYTNLKLRYMVLITITRGFVTDGSRSCYRPGTGTTTGFTCTSSGESTVPYVVTGPVYGKQIQLIIVNTETTLTSEPNSVAAATPTRSSTFPTATSTQTSDPTPRITPRPKKNGISGGAIAGIVVSVLAVAILVAAALFFVRRRKQRQNAASVATPDALPEYVSGNGVTNGPGQMTTTQSSTGLFQPQLDLPGPAR
jgi:hypothetical protein